MTATFGNRCGHDRLNPDFTIAFPVQTGEGGLPLAITRAMERIERYFSSPSLFPTLNMANESDRQQRSERREGCIRMLSTLLKFTDLASLRVGIPTAGGLQALTMDVLVRHCGMNKRRCERAMKDLKAAAMVSSSQPRTRNSDGQIKGLAAIRAISKHVWGKLGMKRLLEIERKKASRRLKELANKTGRTLTEVADNALRLTAIAKKMAGSSPVNTMNNPPKPDPKRYNELIFQLIQEHPDLKPAEIRQMADKLLS